MRVVGVSSYVGARWTWAAIASTLAACGSPEAPPAPPASCGAGECAKTVPASCPAGFAALADEGCVPVVPEQACPAGQRAAVGSAFCAPVGWTTCHDGFEPDASGWGCRAIVSNVVCTGATREAIGRPDCVPIGDCDAPFPPSAATVFVNIAYADGELDEKHHRSIARAIEATPTGGAIAIDAGVYRESITLRKAVQLVGRCAEKVVLDDDGSDSPGVSSLGAKTAIRGMTIRGRTVGVRVDEGHFTLEDSRIESCRWVGIGLGAPRSSGTLLRSVIRNTTAAANGLPVMGAMVNQRTQLTLVDSVLAANEFTNLGVYGEGARATVQSSVLREGRVQSAGAQAGKGGFGVYAAEGASAEISGTVIQRSRRAGVSAAGGDRKIPSSVRITRTNVVDAVLDDSGYGHGVEAIEGSHVTLQSVLVANNARGAIVATDEGTTIDAAGSVLLGTFGADAPVGPGVGATDRSRVGLVSTAVIASRSTGVTVQRDAEVTLEHSLVQHTRGMLQPSALAGDYFGIGATVLSGGHLRLTSSSLIDNQAMGIFERDAGTRATLTDVLVRHVTPDRNGRYGRGATVQDGAEIELTRSAVDDVVEAGIFAYGATVRATDTTIQRTHPASNGEGFGLAALSGSNLTLTATTIRKNGNIGLVISGSAAFVDTSIVSTNPIGIHVQEGSRLVEQSEPSSDPYAVVVSPTTRFVANETRIGNGSFPLPSPVR